MACASASERNQPGETTLANASLLPELQTPRTSKLRFRHLPQHGSSCPLFAGTGEPTKRNFSRRTLLQAKAGSLVCSQSHVENETRCSTQCGAHPPRRFHRDRKQQRPILRRAKAGRLFSALVRDASTASCFCHQFALEAEDWIREVTAKIVVVENHAAEAPCLARLALPRSERRRVFVPIL